MATKTTCKKFSFSEDAYKHAETLAQDNEYVCVISSFVGSKYTQFYVENDVPFLRTGETVLYCWEDGKLK